MKKFIVVILAILYVSSSTGATVHLHYCMGKLVDRGLWHSEAETCGKCGMEKSKTIDNGCCKDEQKQVKLENDHKIPAGYFLSELVAADTPTSSIDLHDINHPSVTERNPVSNAPPRSCDVAVYIRNCIFRI